MVAEDLSSIYVIGPLGGPWKIGHSQDPRGRLQTLQTSRTDQLTLQWSQETTREKAEDLEKLIHRQLGHRRIRGEWFDLQLEEAIAEVQYAFIRWEGEEGLAFRYRKGLL